MKRTQRNYNNSEINSSLNQSSQENYWLLINKVFGYWVNKTKEQKNIFNKHRD